MYPSAVDRKLQALQHTLSRRGREEAEEQDPLIIEVEIEMKRKTNRFFNTFVPSLAGRTVSQLLVALLRPASPLNYPRPRSCLALRLI